MEIDLSKVIGYSRSSLQSRALMRSIMLDLYPGKTREMNVLLDVYESGVPRKIKNDGTINDVQYAQYIQKIVDEYGVQEALIVDALDAWIDACLGKGSAAKINYKKATVGQPPGHLVHQQPKPIAPVTGNLNDYEIRIISADRIEISKFVGFDEAKTIIPNEIDNKRVIGIGSAAFSNCKGIQQLIVSEGIEYIDCNAFQNCDSLRQVIFPMSLKCLGHSAFSRTSLVKLDLPNGIKKIGDRAFLGCKSLQTVILPDYLVEIGNSAFASCEALENVVLPNSMKIIGNNAFSECGKMTKIVLNEGLTEIGGGAFKQCSSLKTLRMPSTVIKFGSKIFEGRYSFENISVIVECYQGSKAIEYLRNNNIKMKAISTQGGQQDRKITIPQPITHKPIDRVSPAVASGKNDYETRNVTADTIEISKYVGFDESKTIIPNEIDEKRVVGIGIRLLFFNSLVAASGSLQNPDR